jgi:hypothetical protein
LPARSPYQAGAEGARITEDVERSEEPALLRIESGRKQCVVEPLEAIRIRDGLRRAGEEAGDRLATIIDAKATELLAAPLYAGTVSVRIDHREEASLLGLLVSWEADGSMSREAGQLRNLLGVLRDD